MHLWGEADLCLVFGPDWKSSLLLRDRCPAGCGQHGQCLLGSGHGDGPGGGAGGLVMSRALETGEIQAL